MHKIIISAPFGNYWSYPGCTSTLGSFTVEYRGGLMYRLWRCLRTLRYKPSLGGWINKLGLPNPGIDSLRISEESNLYDQKIISVHGFTGQDWEILLHQAVYLYKPLAIELNLSCPNVGHGRDDWKSVDYGLKTIVQKTSDTHLIAKLPPLRWVEMAEWLYERGIKHFHCCNTIPTPSGGLSGKVQKQYALWCVEDLRKRFGDSVKLIGGGGVTCRGDVRDYREAGADRVAVGSFLIPFARPYLKARHISEFVEEANR